MKTLSALVPLALLLSGHPVLAQAGESFREDASRLERRLGMCMTPAEHAAAMKSTGMEAARRANEELVRRSKPGDPPLKSTDAWTFLGPRGDFGERNGRVSSVRFYPSSGGTTAYAGSCMGGLWKADLATIGTWSPLSDTLENLSSRAFAIDPTDESHIVVGTGEQGRFTGSGIFYRDASGAWIQSVIQPTATPLPDFIGRIVFKADDANVLLACTSKGIVRSWSGGQTWFYEIGGCIASDLDAHPTDPEVFYVPLYDFAVPALNGLYKGENGGADWSQIGTTSLPVGTAFGRSSLAICRNSPNVMVLLVANSAGDPTGVYKSINGGDDWTNITGTLIVPQPSGPPQYSWGLDGKQMKHVQSVAIKPDDPNRIYIAGRGLIVSEDGGSTWLETMAAHGVDWVHNDIADLYFDPLTGNDTLWLCTDGGLYQHTVSTQASVSVNGGANGLAVSQIYFMDADRAVRGIGMQDTGTLRSVDGGFAWDDFGDGDGASIEIADPVTQDLWFTAGPFTSVPPTWHIFRLNFGSGAEFMQNEEAFYAPIFYDPWGKRVYTIGSEILYSQLATEAPGSWQPEVVSGWVQDGPWNLERIWGSRANGDTLFANYGSGDADDNERDVTIFERKTDGTWLAHHSEDLAPAGSTIWRIIPSTEWPGECWATVLGSVGTPKILHTTDYGETWETLSGVLDGVTIVWALANTPFDPLTLYAGTDIGAFKTTDGGVTWAPFQELLPQTPVRELHFVPDDAKGATHKLVAATDGRGLWERDVVLGAILYVNKNAWTIPGTPDGTFEHPYTTIDAAVSAAPAGSIIAIHSETYLEPAVTTKNVRLVTWAGTTVVH